MWKLNEKNFDELASFAIIRMKKWAKMTASADVVAESLPTRGDHLSQTNLVEE